MRILLIIILSAASCLAFSKLGTVYTTNGSQSDVQAASDNASPGDRVNIPAGTFNWAVAISIGSPITVAGAGKTLTILTGAGFDCSNSSGWRITAVNYQSNGGYFVFVYGVYGLIDNCYARGAAGNNELIFTRGPADSWQTDSSIGGANNVFIEDCQFENLGYVCDINSNGRAVVRFNEIGPAAAMKVDAHGKASNFPPRGVRHMEVYANKWTDSGGFWAAIELRGGSGMCFDNTSVDAGWLMPVEYGCIMSWPNFGRLMTPADYPIDDQIGVGKDPKVGGSEPYYLWNNRQGANKWPLAWKATGGNFEMQEIIAADRDYFDEAASFNGSSGVGRGTKAQMNAIAPTKTGVGFWVTDEGEWNSNHAGADGQLYTWTGSAWVLKYTPYTYPHPLRSGAAPTPTPTPSPTPNPTPTPTPSPSPSPATIQSLNVQNLIITGP